MGMSIKVVFSLYTPTIYHLSLGHYKHRPENVDSASICAGHIEGGNITFCQSLNFQLS